MNTYFSGELSARRPITIVVGIILTAVGIIFEIMWIPQMYPIELKVTSGAFFACIFIIVIFGAGIFLLYKIIFGPKTVLLISSDGIKYGEKNILWSVITELGVVQKYSKRRDLYCITKMNKYIVELSVTKGLTDTEIAELFNKLKIEVVPLYPKLQLNS